MQWHGAANKQREAAHDFDVGSINYEIIYLCLIDIRENTELYTLYKNVHRAQNMHDKVSVKVCE